MVVAERAAESEHGPARAVPCGPVERFLRCDVVVGFDAPGETVELRLTARDRSAYAAGILASADWLVRTRPTAGVHPFDAVVDDVVARRSAAA